MRLDKFLKVSRILKRRATANAACEAKKVSVNGKPSKPAYQLKIGDKVSVGFGSGELNFIVKALTETVKKEDASSLYEIISENNDKE